MRYHGCGTRRGYVMVLTAIALVILLGMAAVSVDVGLLVAVRQSAQDVADAAALAGASVLRTGMDETAARQAAADIASANLIMGRPVVIDPASDIEVGAWDADTQQIVEWSPAFDTLAVRAAVHYTEGEPNGAVPMHFAHYLGHADATVEADAVASVGFSGAPRKPVDLMFVQDASGSFSEEWSQAITADATLCDLVNDVSISGDQIGIAVFNNALKYTYRRVWIPWLGRYDYLQLAFDLEEVPVDGDFSETNLAVRNMILHDTPNGYTNPATGINFAIDSILDHGGDDHEKVIVLVSDGMPVGSTTALTQQYRNETVAAADRAAANGIRIHTVTLTLEEYGQYGYGGADFEFNEGLVRNGGYAFRTHDPARLQDILIAVGGIEYGKAHLIK